ncbi:hypothetical protein LZ31DRAFT_287912 [Colletotrichum somersetense]|nr:hypothetical protein LZ31DRAFT_287912 [Colletotrichum somersetense]
MRQSNLAWPPSAGSFCWVYPPYSQQSTLFSCWIYRPHTHKNTDLVFPASKRCQDWLAWPGLSLLLSCLGSAVPRQASKSPHIILEIPGCIQLRVGGRTHNNNRTI